MTEKIAKRIWDKIRWVSLTEKELDTIISSYTLNPKQINEIKSHINRLSIEEC